MTAPHPPPVAAPEGMRGIVWMLLAMMMFVLQDGTAKYLMGLGHPMQQVVWARFTVHILAVVLFLNWRIARVARSNRLRLQIWRSVILAVTTMLFYSALRTLPLADASALFYLSPVLVTALSVPLLGEYVGPRRWAGVGLSFVGAMIIIRPGTAMMDAAMLLPLGAAFTLALFQISTRQVSRFDAPLTSLFYTALAGALATSAVVPFYWLPPDAVGWMLLCLLGLFGIASQFFMIKAFAAAPAPTVAPFIYSSLVWATGFGFVIFGDLPDGWTVTGAAVIAGSGIYIFYREKKRGRQRADGAVASP